MVGTDVGDGAECARGQLFLFGRRVWQQRENEVRIFKERWQVLIYKPMVGLETSVTGVTVVVFSPLALGKPLTRPSETANQP